MHARTYTHISLDINSFSPFFKVRLMEAEFVRLKKAVGCELGRGHLESVNDIIAASRTNEEMNSSLLGFAEMQQVRHN